MVYLSDVGLPRLSWKKRQLSKCSSSNSSSSFLFVQREVVKGTAGDADQLDHQSEHDNQGQHSEHSDIGSHLLFVQMEVVEGTAGDTDQLDHQLEHDEQDRHSEHSDHDQNAANLEGSKSIFIIN